VTVAPDIQINANDRPPTGFVISPSRPSVIIEVNGRPTSVAILSGSVEAVQVDGNGQVSGAESALTPFTPLALGSSARWRLTFDGSADAASPLVFT
jgi:hypothetical protein